jgi:uncharacterized membrane protein
MSEAKLSETLAIVSVIDPDAYTTGTHLGDAIDMSVHRRIMVIVSVGTFVTGGTAGTVTCVLTEATTSSGTYRQISGKSITALTRAGTDDDKQAIINLSADELSAGYRYVKVSMRVNVKGADAASIALAGQSRYADAAASTTYCDLASVDEIVA